MAAKFAAAGCAALGGMGTSMVAAKSYWNRGDACELKMLKSEVVAISKVLDDRRVRINQLQTGSVSNIDESLVNQLVERHHFDPITTRYALMETKGNVQNAEVLLYGHHVKHTV